jgi:hypothetical protein
MRFRIQADLRLLRTLGVDSAAWASAYLKQRRYFDGDLQHIELAAWFDAAIGAGRRGEDSDV